MMGARVVGSGGLNAFVPDGDSRKDTAILLVAAVRDHGLSPRSIRASQGGFYVTDELADLIYDEVPFEDGGTVEESTEESEPYDPADHTVAQVKEFVSEHPDIAPDVLASEEGGENRATLTKWLNEFSDTHASGNRAEKNSTTEKE